jgi:arylsulfatase A-like enzyme
VDALMPNLHRLGRTRGALLGGPRDVDAIWATGPNFVSLPGYREILTGSASTDCQENDCEPLTVDTIADQFRARGARMREVAVISSWEGIEKAASRRPESIIVSTGRTHGHNRDALASDPSSEEALVAGEQASPLPGTEDFRPDALTARIALGYLARERPRFLFLGLGEPDEYGHLDDYAGYLASLRAADRVIGQIDELFEKTGAWKRDALLVVTTDHGRASDFRNHGRSAPESGRVWLMAAGRRIARPAFAPSWRVLHLADIAPTVRRLAGLLPDPSGSTGAPIASLVALGR